MKLLPDQPRDTGIYPTQDMPYTDTFNYVTRAEFTTWVVDERAEDVLLRRVYRPYYDAGGSKGELIRRYVGSASAIESCVARDTENMARARRVALAATIAIAVFVALMSAVSVRAGEGAPALLFSAVGLFGIGMAWNFAQGKKRDLREFEEAVGKRSLDPLA